MHVNKTTSHAVDDNCIAKKIKIEWEQEYLKGIDGDVQVNKNWMVCLKILIKG